jgi:murein DD-endopeptidase MepM/ murein hydrolase activator NlpD
MALRSTRNPIGKNFLLLGSLALVALALITVVVLFVEGSKPVVELVDGGTYLGRSGEIGYRISDGDSGIRRFRLSLRQGEKSQLLHEEEFERASFRRAAGPLLCEGRVPFEPGKAGFGDGAVEIIVEASDFSWGGWLGGNKTVLKVAAVIDTEPPRLNLLHGQRYILPGGSGIAIYRLSDPDSRHGVELDGRFHPGFPVGDGRDDTYIAYFALPYDQVKVESLKVVATDRAGNSAAVPFSPVVKKANQKRDSIAISDAFLAAKIPEFEEHYPEMDGDLLAKYLYVNQVLRVENNNRISQLCGEPAAERFWRGSFQRMPGSSRAGFADHRTYTYNGKEIDAQTHLGVDIASTRQADVRAANGGRVIFADYLGIYGNMVLLDHGQGVFSLYSHLSQMNVTPGTMVDQQTVLGLTGTSGMAGGDHLHFSMLINGEFVTPVEWWDQHWLEVNIEEPLTDSRF